MMIMDHAEMKQRSDGGRPMPVPSSQGPPGPYLTGPYPQPPMPYFPNTTPQGIELPPHRR